jgi:hypothetical protein
MTASRPYSILITDDDRDSRETLRDIVAPQGYRTILAASGEEALEIIHVEPIHLVLLDMHMARLTGLETVRLMHGAAVHPRDGRRRGRADPAGAERASIQRDPQAGQQERRTLHRGPCVGASLRPADGPGPPGLRRLSFHTKERNR